MSTTLLTVAGSLELGAAAIHGGGGEFLVVRKLSAETLPSASFGSARMTKAMIHAAWHMATVGAGGHSAFARWEPQRDIGPGTSHPGYGQAL